MDVIDLKQQDPRVWHEQLISHYPYAPFSWIRTVDTVSRQALLCRDIDRACESDQTRLLGVQDGDGILLGFAQFGKLDWDSHHYGFDVWGMKHVGFWGTTETRATAGDTLCAAVVDETKGQGAATIHARVPLDNIGAIHALENSGFRVMEVQTLWLFDLHKQPIPAYCSGFEQHEMRPENATEAIELARHAYTGTPDRFHADPHLAEPLSDALYADWIRNCISGQEADYMTVTMDRDRVIGYGTLRYWGDQDGCCNVRIGQLLLGAVDPAYRERGVNVDVMAGMLHWLREAGADVAYVGTQANNISSLISMTKLGWRPVHSALGLHAWLADS